jgi:hypothetical protein
VVDRGDAPARSGDVQVAEGVRHDTGKMMGCSSSSVVSCEDAERPLEELQTTVTSGRGWSGRFAAQSDRWVALGDAPENEEKK